MSGRSRTNGITAGGPATRFVRPPAWDEANRHAIAVGKSRIEPPLKVLYASDSRDRICIANYLRVPMGKATSFGVPKYNNAR